MKRARNTLRKWFDKHYPKIPPLSVAALASIALFAAGCGSSQPPTMQQTAHAIATGQQQPLQRLTPNPPATFGQTVATSIQHVQHDIGQTIDKVGQQVGQR